MTVAAKAVTITAAATIKRRVRFMLFSLRLLVLDIPGNTDALCTPRKTRSKKKTGGRDLPPANEKHVVKVTPSQSKLYGTREHLPCHRGTRWVPNCSDIHGREAVPAPSYHQTGDS